jgi:DNA-directed RNA polymerase subunit RPC12/RpoP
MLEFFKRPTCALCKHTEPMGLARDIIYVMNSGEAEYKLCRFCWTMAKRDGNLLRTSFPPEFDTSPQKRRSWLVQLYDQLHPVGKPLSPAELKQTAGPGAETAPRMETDKSVREFPCAVCRKPIPIPESEGGKTINCPHCGAEVEVPLTFID